MSAPSEVDLSSGEEALGVLAFRGPDAARFLQGQLSADVEKLPGGGSVLAGLHNPQGRVVALLALARTDPESIYAVLPRELASAVATRLRKYVLRSKVRIEESTGYAVLGAWQAPVSPDTVRIRWGERHLLVVPADGQPAAGDAASRAAWMAQDIRDGLPQVYTTTSEAFVAQMLNLDLLGAIAFDKGCYTGQEVIARAHYRGRVKRRLQRWRAPAAEVPAPGGGIQAQDGRALTVVRVAPVVDGTREFLAIGNYGPAEESGEPAAGGPATGPLPLPYSLPE